MSSAATFDSIGRNAQVIADLSRLLAEAARRPGFMTPEKLIETRVELACRSLALARDVDRFVVSPTVYE